LSSSRHYAAGLLTLLAWAVASPAGAGMFATEATLADFTFADGRVVYTTPSLGNALLELTAENAVQLRAPDTDSNTGAFDPRSGFIAQLNLGSRLIGAAPAAGKFMLFGSIPPAADAEISDLTSGTFDAMQVDSNDGSLDFLLDDKAVTGGLARKYQSIGIYARVGGIDDVDWIRQYDSSASIMNLATDGTGVGGVGEMSAPATPVPATALLILSGLFALRYCRPRS